MKLKDSWRYDALLKDNADSIDNYLEGIDEDGQVKVFIPSSKSAYNADITMKIPSSQLLAEYKPNEWNDCKVVQPPKVGKYRVKYSDGSEGVLEYISKLEGDPGSHWFYEYFNNPTEKKILAFKHYQSKKMLKKHVIDMLRLLVKEELTCSNLISNIEELYNDKSKKDVSIHLEKNETKSGLSLTLRFNDSHFASY